MSSMMCSLIGMVFQFYRNFPQMIGVVQTAHVNFVMNILVMMLKTLLMVNLCCVVVPSVKRCVCDYFFTVLSNLKYLTIFIPDFQYYLLLLFFKITNHVFEYSIMMMCADHKACSPEIDSITSDSDESCNLFCQQSCRLVIFLRSLFFFPVAYLLPYTLPSQFSMSMILLMPFVFYFAV